MEQSRQLTYTLQEVRTIKKKAKEDGYKKGWNACKQHDAQMDQFDKKELQKVKNNNTSIQAKCDTIEAELYKLKCQNESLEKSAISCNEALQEQNDNLKTTGNTLARLLRQLSRSVSVHPGFSDESEWGDLVAGAEKALVEWEGENLPAQEVSVFVPCLENDPRCSGGYTSNCGRSLCYVRETTVPVIEQGAIWVKGAPKEFKPHYAKVPSKVFDHITYKAIVIPKETPGYWWAVGDGLAYGLISEEIIEYLDESAGEKEDNHDD